MKKENTVTGKFEKFSNLVTKRTGSPYAFLLAILIVLVWALTGPVFHYSDTWQLVINTGTTIVTFLMVFVIQQSQNKDTLAIQLKLNELIASNKYSSNRLIDVEDLTEEELQTIKAFYVKLSKLAKKDQNLRASHSLDEASEIHEEKLSEQHAVRTSRRKR